MFLGFALPLPARLLTDLSPPIQRWTATASAYLLVTLGVPAVSIGSELILSDSRIAVTEAWSGLETLAACLAVCVAVALLVQTPFWERSLIVLSALPIALVGNVVRLTVAAALPEVLTKWLLRDAGSWLLIPLALGLICIERRFFSRVLVPVRARGPLGLECGGIRT
jgi:exosortase